MSDYEDVGPDPCGHCDCCVAHGKAFDGWKDLTTAVELLHEARGWMVCGEPGSLSDRIDAFLRDYDAKEKQ